MRISLRSVFGAWLFLLSFLAGVLASSAGLSPEGVPSFSDLSGLSVIDRVENEREDLTRVINNLELHYGMVKSRSLQGELGRIARSLTPFLLHPEFPVQIVLIDSPKPACFYLGGETVVLTRGLVFSGFLKNTDSVAGLVALLLSRHDLLEGRVAGGAGSRKDLVKRRNREAKNAAMLLVRAGYHYEGALEAVRILDSLRTGPDWTETLSWLVKEKARILRDSSELEDGISLLLAGRPASSVPFLLRYVDTSPGSIEGRFWLGLAYYRDFYGTIPPSRDTVFFSVDPVPRTPPPSPANPPPRWDLIFARTIWAGILRDNPTYSPAWNGLGRIAMMQGQLKMAVRFFGRAARLNPESPWYSADFALALWMRDHKVLALGRWNDATSQAGFDPRLIYDQSVLGRMGEGLLPVGFSEIKDLPGWEFVNVLWGESIGDKRIRPLPDFIGKFLSSPLLPGMPVGQVRHLVGLPTAPPIESHRYLIWDYRYRNYRIAFRGGVIRIAEFYGKNRKDLPTYPPRPLSDKTEKSPENDPVEVIPYARIAYLRYRTIRHTWIVQRVGTVLDRFIILPSRMDSPGNVPASSSPAGPSSYSQSPPDRENP
jgi:tetratricopeptide (TPR) repeat protein